MASCLRSMLCQAGKQGQAPFSCSQVSRWRREPLANPAVRSTLSLKWENRTCPYIPTWRWDKIALRKALLLRCCKHFLKGDTVSAQCNLIIDSCCDLPLELVQREGVQLIDFNYIIDDKTFKDDFYQSVTPKEFYDNIRNGATPSTSQVAPAETEAAFRDAIESGVPTVYLCFSSGLSSNYSTAYAIWSQLKAEHPEAPIYIVDLLIGSTPEGLLVLEALRQRESGLTAEEMVAWAEEARYFVQTLFMVDDLDALHRGGRIPASVAFAGSKLDLKPLLNFDTNGKLSLAGASHGRKKGLKQLASFCEKAHAENSNFALIGHADSEKDADRVCELLAKQDDSITVIKHNIGATIGSHVGAGMVSISFWGEDRREALSVADKIARKVRKGE